MKADAVATLTAEEKAELKPILDAKPTGEGARRRQAAAVRQEVDARRAGRRVVEKGLKTKRDFDRGRTLFGEAKCFACHRFDNEGGVRRPGPDRRRRPVQRPRPARVDHRAEQGDQRPVRGRATSTTTDGKSSPAGSST